MTKSPRQRQIAYRCPECTDKIFGLIGKFTQNANLLRLKCNCDKSSVLDITNTNDGKIKLSVPCLFCKENHAFTVSEPIFYEREKVTLSCPYAGIDIAFIGTDGAVEEELARTDAEIGRLLAGFEADEISDIQPQEMNDDEILPDPQVYDTLRFVVKELEADGEINCPCKNGKYELRFCEEGVQVYCENCGASYTFNANSPSLAEEYIYTSHIDLR